MASISSYITGQAFKIAVVLLICYVIGSINPASVVAKAAGVNIREEGSGNPGTTNVLRTLGKKAAIITLLIDVLKGVFAVLIGRFLDNMGGFQVWASGMADGLTHGLKWFVLNLISSGEAIACLCGLAAIIGHCWPVFYKFKGGKGAATTLGVVIAVNPIAGLLLIILAILVIVITRRVSFASLIGGISVPVFMYFLTGNTALVIWGVVVGLLLIYRHRSNIARIIKGEEPPMDFAKLLSKKNKTA